MAKLLSTYERKMKNPKFKKAYEEGLKQLLFSELIVSMMENHEKSVRKLAEEANLSLRQLFKIFVQANNMISK